jgi:hypothetical protein
MAKLYNNSGFHMFTQRNNDEGQNLSSLRSTSRHLQLAKVKSSSSLTARNNEEQRKNKLLNCRSAEMFLTTPGLVKRDLKGKDGLKF